MSSHIATQTSVPHSPAAAVLSLSFALIDGVAIGGISLFVTTVSPIFNPIVSLVGAIAIGSAVFASLLASRGAQQRFRRLSREEMGRGLRVALPRLVLHLFELIVIAVAYTAMTSVDAPFVIAGLAALAVTAASLGAAWWFGRVVSDNAQLSIALTRPMDKAAYV